VEENNMLMKSLSFLFVFVLAVLALHGQSPQGATYWSTVPPDCRSLGGGLPVAITNTSGETLGYSCYVSGTFVWYAVGGTWSTALRVAAPASAAIGVDYSFYDKSGNDMRLDVAYGSSTAVKTVNQVSFALSANQPAEVVLLGVPIDAPKYDPIAMGSVYAVFYCPDAPTCGNVLPQLISSALPAIPWSQSVRISWDNELWTQWSTTGIDDGAYQTVALAIYNENITPASYEVKVYDGTGALTGTGVTPVIPPMQLLSNGSLGQGGTYAVYLADLISTPLPKGLFKIRIDGGSKYSAVNVLQYNGPASTALHVVFDSAPTPHSYADWIWRPNISMARVSSRPKNAFNKLE
jgi:hypothetical protein